LYGDSKLEIQCLNIEPDSDFDAEALAAEALVADSEADAEALVADSEADAEALVAEALAVEPCDAEAVG
jgi:hypothetical protein